MKGETEMSFKEFLTEQSKTMEKEMQGKYGLDPFTEWSKVLTPKDVTEAMSHVFTEFEEEDPEIALLGIIVTFETVKNLFPGEEFQELVKQLEAEKEEK